MRDKVSLGIILKLLICSLKVLDTLHLCSNLSNPMREMLPFCFYYQKTGIVAI